MSKDVRIILADDHTVMRSGLRRLLETQAGFIVVGEAATGREAVELVRKLDPDVVVMDVRMPDLNGLDAARQAIEAKPSVKIVALTGVSDEKTSVALVKAGAVGYVPKESAFDDLVKAILTVMDNKVYFNPSIIANAMREPGSENDSVFFVLSLREREVLQLIAEGKSTKEVAFELHISVKTVETHRRNLMEKLQIDSVAALTKYAIREGLTSN